MLADVPIARPLAPGVFFIADGRDDGGTRSVGIIDNGISADSARVTDEVATFLLTDLRRWILLDAKAAEVWFGNALIRAPRLLAAE